jgi:hypothetical protein
MGILEAAIYKPKSGGYVPHIKWSTPLIKLLGGNQSEGLNQKLRESFPNVIEQLNRAGITSKGREMYAKGIIERKFNTELEANQALAIYQSIINSLK